MAWSEREGEGRGRVCKRRPLLTKSGESTYNIVVHSRVKTLLSVAQHGVRGDADDRDVVESASLLLVDTNETRRLHTTHERH